MTFALLPFFLFYLASKNALSVARVLANAAQFWKLLILSLGVLFLCSGFLVWKRKPQLSIIPVGPSYEELAKEATFWEGVYTQQPNHRDVLVNLALLYQQQGKTEKAEEFLAKAQQLDPNFFTVEPPTQVTN